VPSARMVTIGAGEGHPVASNDTPEGRAQNRRVEITIVPVTEDNVNKAKQG
jgi:outer membrane protein OmpA-like peptidoglycan-associated protein